MKLSELFETFQDHLKWVIGDLGSNGILLKSQGISIRLDKKNSDVLITALKAGDNATVKTIDAKEFQFNAGKNGDYNISMPNSSDGLVMSKDNVQQVISLAEESQEDNEI